MERLKITPQNTNFKPLIRIFQNESDGIHTFIDVFL